ncbi:MAG TPA: CHAT domain-containing protein [Bryobacteraceae bacterium]|nr:CHAT domain-containing protein [Bryobacteraceae bacterium]
MSRKSLTLQEAVVWRRAEDAATLAERGTRDQIAASLALWTELGDRASIARTCLKQGDNLWDTNPIGAREAYEEALTMCRSLDDARCSAEAANNSGLAAQNLGEFDRSRERLSEAARLWGAVSDRVSEGITISNVGLMWQHVGDFRNAIETLRQAEAILRKNRAPGSHASTVTDIGLCYLYLAEFDKARVNFQNGLEEATRHGRADVAVHARLNLGRSYLLDGQPVRARAILERTLAESSKLKDASVRGDVLDNLGQTMRALHHPHEARELLEQALSIHIKSRDRRFEAYDLHYLGLTSQDLGDRDAARRYLNRALEIRLACGLRDDASDSLYALANLERDAGRLDPARDLAEQALKLLESVRQHVPGPNLRASFYSRKRRFFDLLVDVAMPLSNEPGAAERGLLAAERGRGRALLDLLAEGSLLRQLPPAELQNSALIQRDLDMLSARLTAAKPADEATIRHRMEALTAENVVVEAHIRQLIEDQAGTQPLSSFSQLQNNGLPADSALLEFHLGDRQSYLWYVDRMRVRVFPLPSREKIANEARAAIEEFGRILERRRSPARQAAFEQSMQQLSATLLGGLKDVNLPPRLILALDGVLLRVPFAALELPFGHQRLGLVHNLVQVPSAAYLLAGRKPRPSSAFPKSILALADPVFSPGDPRVPEAARKPPAADLARLPFTAELDTIRKAVPPSRYQILKGFEVSRENVARLRLEEFGVLHFSTHALIDDRIPEISRIALSLVDAAGRPADGFLRPYQLSELRLDGPVVVLSACDTALGKQVLGEGLAGLSSSLFAAGAAQLVLTLTEVDAEASSELLSHVYNRYLTGTTAGIEHSLMLARQAMVSQPRWSDPYYWAGFVVIGRTGE